jgi:hypothetical protein
MTRQPDRLLAAGILALVGVALGAIMAVASAVESPVAFVLLATLSAAIAGALLAPSIRARRPLVGLAVALVTYVVGVLLFPPFSILGGVGAPGLKGSFSSTENLLAIYFFTPLGFLLALPFLPAVIATGILGARVVQSRIPVGDDPPTEADVAANRRFRRRLAWAGLGLGLLTALGFVLLTSVKPT